MTGTEVRKARAKYQMLKRILIRRRMKHRSVALDRVRKSRCFVSIGDAFSPDGTEACVVTQISRYNVDMELGDDIAESADVDLAALRCRLQKVGCMGDFAPELCLLLGVEVKDLGHSISLGHQDKPGIARVVHQKD